MKVKKTSRGFELIEFVDLYDEPCSLQQSSLASMPAVWLGCDNNTKPDHVTGEVVSPRMHLNHGRVKALIRHLQSWLDTGSFKP